jgi:hypothetical protein
MPTGNFTFSGFEGRRENDVTRPEPFPVE